MKLSTREKVMLIVLGVVALNALSYFFLFKPQMTKLANLALECNQCKAQVDKVKDEIALNDKLDKDIKDMTAKIADKSSRFYPEILQDKIVVTLDGLLKKSVLKASSASFAEIQIKAVTPAKAAPQVLYPMKDLVGTYKAIDSNATCGGTAANPAAVSAAAALQAALSQASASNTASPQTGTPQAAATQSPMALGLDMLENMTVTIQYEGSYEQLIQFIKALEDMKRTVVISNLAMAKGQDNKLQGSIQLDIYALPKVLDQDKEYFDWPYKDQYGKANPFVK